MRRLPVFFVLDVSESMVGDNLRNLQDGLTEIVRALSTDAHAVESVHLSVIAFAGQARTIAPLVELESFYTPKLPIGSGTSLGAALEHLMSEIDRQIVRTTADKKGDWKPIVYLMTDGKPTDNVAPAIRKWREKYASRAMMVAIAIGEMADQSALLKLTDTVLVFSQRQPGDFNKFIRWVSASIAVQSQHIDTAKQDLGGVTLAKLEGNVLEFSKGTQQGGVDQDTVILVGRCQKKKAPYLMRFDRFNVPVPGLKAKPGQTPYTISGCYPVDEEYFEWSATDGVGAEVSTNALLGGAGCPHCANPFAFAVCQCGKLMFLAGPGEATCPWCEKLGTYGQSDEGDPGMTISRGRG